MLMTLIFHTEFRDEASCLPKGLPRPSLKGYEAVVEEAVIEEAVVEGAVESSPGPPEPPPGPSEPSK